MSSTESIFFVVARARRRAEKMQGTWNQDVASWPWRVVCVVWYAWRGVGTGHREPGHHQLAHLAPSLGDLAHAEFATRDVCLALGIVALSGAEGGGGANGRGLPWPAT